MKVRSALHTPERSGLPSAVRGVGPVGTFTRDCAARAVPPPVGSVGDWARAARANRARPHTIPGLTPGVIAPSRKGGDGVLRRAGGNLDVVDILIILLADVLHQNRSRHQPRVELHL